MVSDKEHDLFESFFTVPDYSSDVQLKKLVNDVFRKNAEAFDQVRSSSKDYCLRGATAKKRKTAILNNMQRARKEFGKLSLRSVEESFTEFERFSNVDRFMAGELDKDDYQRIRAELLDKQIEETSAKLHESEAAADDGVRDAVSTMKKYSGETELTREIVEAFIDKILIYDPEHIEIRWKFPDDVVKFIEG